jgi:UDP-2,3-diacylglucosamine hydrolase
VSLPAGALAVALGDGDRALFASDMHLDDREPATADAFFEALAGHGAKATHLFLLGDLFEAWVGDDDPSEVGQRLARALSSASAAGKRVYLMRGNRDFLLDAPLSTRSGPAGGAAPFSQRCGASMLTDPSVVSLFGVATMLSHGDALCTDDLDYQAFRAESRSARWQGEFLAQPLARRIEAARAMRERSRTEKGAKSDELMDVNAGAVENAMREAGVALLIHGHTHRPARHAWTSGGATLERWVLPDWVGARRRGGMLLASREGFSKLGNWG